MKTEKKPTSIDAAWKTTELKQKVKKKKTYHAPKKEKKTFRKTENSLNSLILWAKHPI